MRPAAHAGQPCGASCAHRRTSRSTRLIPGRLLPQPIEPRRQVGKCHSVMGDGIDGHDVGIRLPEGDERRGGAAWCRSRSRCGRGSRRSSGRGPQRAGGRRRCLQPAQCGRVGRRGDGHRPELPGQRGKGRRHPPLLSCHSTDASQMAGAARTERPALGHPTRHPAPGTVTSRQS